MFFEICKCSGIIANLVLVIIIALTGYLLYSQNYFTASSGSFIEKFYNPFSTEKSEQLGFSDSNNSKSFKHS